MARKTGKSVSAGKALNVESLENRRLLSATLSVSQSMMVFNAVINTTSTTQTLTLTDTGNAALSLSGLSLADDPSVSTQDVLRFTLVNASSMPASLSPGQSFGLTVNYNAIAVGINSAFLDIASSDPVNPTQQIALRGIGTAGLGGTSQPSLQRILEAYEIPTLVGEADTATVYPNPPGANSQEVVLQRLVKAGPGPVTIQVLASFTASGFAKSYVLGTYPPGDPTDLNQLFYTPGNENQTTYVQPQGATSFDPGNSAFGFYFISNSQVKGRVGYSEDSLNTWDTTNDRKFRFFPMENPNGSVVPNAYIMTSTEWNAPSGYDFTNIVAIVRNVMAAPGAPTGPVMGLQNMNPLPGSNTMIFSTIKTQNATLGDQFHNVGILQVNNTGGSQLVISSYTISSAWTLLNASTLAPPTFPLDIAAGASLKLAVKFIATTEPSHPYNETNDTTSPNGGGVYTGSLTLNSNDPTSPDQTIPLAGWWQSQSENNNEPDVQSLVNLMVGWGTDINATPINDLTESQVVGSKPVYYGEEVVSAYWSLADPSLPANIVQLDAFHTQGNTGTLSAYYQGSKSLTKLIVTAADDGQTVFPYAYGTTTAATTNFNPSNPSTAVFGFNVDGYFTNDAYNTAVGSGHQFRFYPVRTSQGVLVPNAYILLMDYPVALPAEENFDFQDNVYIVSNIHPATIPAAPTDVYATAAPSGGVMVQWAPVQDPNLAGYNVYRSTSSNTGFTLISTSLLTTPGYLDASAPAGTTVYYRVTAVDSVTSAESLGSEASAASTSTANAPPPPTNFTASSVEGGVSLSWTAPTDPTLAGYDVLRSSTASGQYTLLTSSPITTTTYTDTLAPVGVATYYEVTTVDGSTNLQSTPATTSGIALQNAPLNGLQSADINASIAGTTTVVTSGSSFNVVAGGPGVTGTSDGFRFIYQQQTGNFDMRVNVASITVAGNFSTAGIMARSTLDPAAANVYMSASPANYRFKDRASAGATEAVIVGGTTSFPGAWVRLTRVGNLFTGYSSLDGINWTVVSSVTLNLGSPVYLGLAIASNNSTATTTAQLQSYGQTQGGGIISGIAYSDPTDVGSFVSGDLPLVGWDVFLDLNGTGVYDPGVDPVAVTGANGSYSLGNLTPGTYHVDLVTQALYRQTQPSSGGYTIPIALGQNSAGNNFGAQQLASISGTVFDDLNGNGVMDTGEPPLVGWGVFLDFNNTGIYNPSNDVRLFSDSNGNFDFIGLIPGSYRVAEGTPAGWSRTVPSGSSYYVTITAGENLTGQNFGANQNGSISGNIFQDLNADGTKEAGEPGLAGWGVFLDINHNGVYDPGTDVRVFSDVNGNYTIPNLAPGTYSVMQGAVTGWNRTAPSSLPDNVTVVAGQTTTVNFGETPQGIFGTVFNDIDGTGIRNGSDPGLAGWGVFINSVGNTSDIYNAGIDTRTFTNASGQYSFVGLAPGTYDINEGVPSGWTRTTPDLTGYVVTIANGQIFTDQDFGNFQDDSGPTDEIAQPTVTVFANASPPITDPNDDLSNAYATLESAGLFELNRWYGVS